MSKKVFIIPVIAFVAVIAIYLAQKSALPDPNTVVLSGNIEVTEVEVSFEIPGKVVERYVSEGEKVAQGEYIALLDTQELEHEAALREAELLAAQAALLELAHGYLPEEINQAKAKLRQAAAQFQRLSTDMERQKTLFDGDVISSREFDASKSAYEVAEAQVKEASEKLSLLKRGIRKEKIAQAEANVVKSSQAVELAKTRLGYSKLRAPISGYVLSDNVEAGEYVRPGTPVVTLANLKDVWLKAYVDETDLGKVKLGQNVDVKVDSFPDKIYQGTVTFIAQEAEFTPKNVQTLKERVKLVYRVKIDIPNTDLDLKPGMPADGVITLYPTDSKNEDY